MNSIDTLTRIIKQNFTSFIMSYESVNLVDSSIISNRISICAPTVNVETSQINANGKGCDSSNGLTAGSMYENCAGTGGSNGGNGGYGGAESADP